MFSSIFFFCLVESFVTDSFEDIGQIALIADFFSSLYNR